MRIIDGSGTHTFNALHCRGFDNYTKEKRRVLFDPIDEIKEEDVFGTSKFVTIDFLRLDATQRDELNDIFIDNNITKIDTLDEYLSGESYDEYTGVTDPIFIETNKFNARKSINSRDILYYQTRLTFRFDTVTTIVKP